MAKLVQRDLEEEKKEQEKIKPKKKAEINKTMRELPDDFIKQDANKLVDKLYTNLKKKMGKNTVEQNKDAELVLKSKIKDDIIKMQVNA